MKRLKWFSVAISLLAFMLNNPVLAEGDGGSDGGGDQDGGDHYDGDGHHHHTD